MNNFSMIFFPDLPFLGLFFFSRKKNQYCFSEKRKNGDRKESPFPPYTLLQGHAVPRQELPEGQQEGLVRDLRGPRLRRTQGSRRGPGRALPSVGAAGLDPVLTSEASPETLGETEGLERGAEAGRGLGLRATAPSV